MAEFLEPSLLSGTGRLPVSPSLEPVRRAAHVPQVHAVVGPRVALMVSQNVGRLPVVSRAEPERVVGILTRSDILSAHARRLTENAPVPPRLKLPLSRPARA